MQLARAIAGGAHASWAGRPYPLSAAEARALTSGRAHTHSRLERDRAEGPDISLSRHTTLCCTPYTRPRCLPSTECSFFSPLLTTHRPILFTTRAPLALPSRGLASGLRRAAALARNQGSSHLPHLPRVLVYHSDPAQARLQGPSLGREANPGQAASRHHGDVVRAARVVSPDLAGRPRPSSWPGQSSSRVRR